MNNTIVAVSEEDGTLDGSYNDCAILTLVYHYLQSKSRVTT